MKTATLVGMVLFAGSMFVMVALHEAAAQVQSLEQQTANMTKEQVVEALKGCLRQSESIAGQRNREANNAAALSGEVARLQEALAAAEQRIAALTPKPAPKPEAK